MSILLHFTSSVYNLRKRGNAYALQTFMELLQKTGYVFQHCTGKIICGFVHCFVRTAGTYCLVFSSFLYLQQCLLVALLYRLPGILCRFCWWNFLYMENGRMILYRTFLPLAISLKVHPSISDAFRHIIILPRKISKYSYMVHIFSSISR